MKLWKKHAAVPLLLVAALLIGTTYSTILGAKDKGTFYLEDIKGDRSAIGDVTIQGELVDGYHHTQFQIGEHAVKTKTNIRDFPEAVNLSGYSYGGRVRMDGVEYEVSWQNPYEILAYHNPSNNGMTVRKAVLPRDAVQPNVSIFTNVQEYGLAKAGDSIYFTVPTTRMYKGMNGIYKLSFTEQNGSEAGEQASTTLVTFEPKDFSLRDNTVGLDVLGLEAVGETLVLITAENGTLVVKAIDSKSGAWLGEAVIDEIAIVAPSGLGESTPVSAEIHSERYEAYPDHANGTLNLSFRSSESAGDGLVRSIVSIDLSDGIKRIQVLKARFQEGEEVNNPLTAIAYRNGKLYIAKTFRVIEEEGFHPYQITRSQHLYLYVYQGPSLLYQGRLVTDMNDDNIHALNAWDGISYQNYEYRDFNQLRIQ